ncbi:hypothetical protein ATCC90586_006855 [Pythium insidiosum]|nr:hypothetical protein ATCC90586_006855 [Pythium insidiosum]
MHGQRCVNKDGEVCGFYNGEVVANMTFVNLTETFENAGIPLEMNSFALNQVVFDVFTHIHALFKSGTWQGYVAAVAGRHPSYTFGGADNATVIGAPDYTDKARLLVNSTDRTVYSCWASDYLFMKVYVFEYVRHLLHSELLKRPSIAAVFNVTTSIRRYPIVDERIALLNSQKLFVTSGVRTVTQSLLRRTLGSTSITEIQTIEATKKFTPSRLFGGAQGEPSRMIEYMWYYERLYSFFDNRQLSRDRYEHEMLLAGTLRSGLNTFRDDYFAMTVRHFLLRERPLDDESAKRITRSVDEDEAAAAWFRSAQSRDPISLREVVANTLDETRDNAACHDAAIFLLAQVTWIMALTETPILVALVYFATMSGARQTAPWFLEQMLKMQITGQTSLGQMRSFQYTDPSYDVGAAWPMIPLLSIFRDVYGEQTTATMLLKQLNVTFPTLAGVSSGRIDFSLQSGCVLGRGQARPTASDPIQTVYTKLYPALASTVASFLAMAPSVHAAMMQEVSPSLFIRREYLTGTKVFPRPIVTHRGPPVFAEHTAFNIGLMKLSTKNVPRQRDVRKLLKFEHCYDVLELRYLNITTRCFFEDGSLTERRVIKSAARLRRLMSVLWALAAVLNVFSFYIGWVVTCKIWRVFQLTRFQDVNLFLALDMNIQGPSLVSLSEILIVTASCVPMLISRHLPANSEFITKQSTQQPIVRELLIALSLTWFVRLGMELATLAVHLRFQNYWWLTMQTRLRYLLVLIAFGVRVKWFSIPDGDYDRGIVVLIITVLSVTLASFLLSVAAKLFDRPGHRKGDELEKAFARLGLNRMRYGTLGHTPSGWIISGLLLEGWTPTERQGRIVLSRENHAWMKTGVRKNGQKLQEPIEKAFAFVDWMVQLTRDGDAGRGIPRLERLQPSYALNTIVTSSQRAGSLPEAQRAFDLLHKYGYEPDVFTYTALIDVIARNNDVRGAMKRYEEMRSTKSRPNIVTITTIIRSIGFTQDVDPSVCLTYLEHAQEEEAFDESLYVDALDVCAIRQDLITARAVLQQIAVHAMALRDSERLVRQIAVHAMALRDSERLVRVLAKLFRHRNDRLQVIAAWKDDALITQVEVDAMESAHTGTTQCSGSKTLGCLGNQTSDTVRQAVVQHDINRLVERISENSAVSTNDFETLIHQCRKRKWKEEIQVILTAMRTIAAEELARMHGFCHEEGVDIVARKLPVSSHDKRQHYLEELVLSCAYKQNTTGVSGTIEAMQRLGFQRSARTELAAFFCCLQHPQLEPAMAMLHSFQRRAHLLTIPSYESLLRELYFKYTRRVMFAQHVVEAITTIRDKDSKVATQAMLRGALQSTPDPLLFNLRAVTALRLLDVAYRGQGKLAKQMLLLLPLQTSSRDGDSDGDGSDDEVVAVQPHHLEFCMSQLPSLTVHIVKELDDVLLLHRHDLDGMLAFCAAALEKDNVDKTIGFIVSKEALYTVETATLLMPKLAELYVEQGVVTILQFFKPEVEHSLTIRRQFLREVLEVERFSQDNGDDDDEDSEDAQLTLPLTRRAVIEFKLQHELEFMPLVTRTFGAADLGRPRKEVALPDGVSYLAMPLASSQIVFVDQDDAVALAYEVLMHSGQTARVGIDAEWRPDARGYAQSPCSVLQIACDSHVFLFDLVELAMSDVEELFAFVFGSPSVLKLGFALDGDIRRLKWSFPDVSCFDSVVNVLDFAHDDLPADRKALDVLANDADREKRALELRAERTRRRHRGLAALVLEHLGSALDKRQQRSDWELRPLTDAQIEYAALDAYCLLMLHDRMRCA